MNLRTLNELAVALFFAAGCVGFVVGQYQTGATLFLVAATWRLGNTWTER